MSVRTLRLDDAAEFRKLLRERVGGGGGMIQVPVRAMASYLIREGRAERFLWIEGRVGLIVKGDRGGGGQVVERLRCEEVKMLDPREEED